MLLCVLFSFSSASRGLPSNQRPRARPGQNLPTRLTPKIDHLRLAPHLLSSFSLANGEENKRIKQHDEPSVCDEGITFNQKPVQKLSDSKLRSGKGRSCLAVGERNPFGFARPLAFDISRRMPHVKFYTSSVNGAGQGSGPVTQSHWMARIPHALQLSVGHMLDA